MKSGDLPQDVKNDNNVPSLDRFEKWFSKNTFIEVEPPVSFDEGQQPLKQKKLSREELDSIIQQRNEAEEHVVKLYRSGNLYGACQLIAEIVPNLPREEVELAANLRLRRFLYLINLGHASTVSKELEKIDCLHMEYDDFSEQLPDRLGKINSFNLEFIQVLIPLYTGDYRRAIDKSCKLLIELKIGKYSGENVNTSLRVKMLTCELVGLLTHIEEYELAENIMKTLAQSTKDSCADILNYNLIRLLIQNKKIQEANKVLDENKISPGPLLDTVELLMELLPEQ